MARMHALALALQLTAAVSTASTTLDAGTIQAATLEAARIWQPHLQLSFARAGDPRIEPDLTIVITDVVFAATNDEAVGIGQIRFSAPGKPMNMVYLSVSGARRLAADAQWRGLALEQTPERVRRTFLAHALGRALAHEIGHFLLRSTAHSTRGLMRPRYLTPELMDESLQPYSLSGAQASVIARSVELLARNHAMASDQPPDRRPQ